MDDRTKRRVGFGALAIAILVAGVLLLTMGGDDGDGGDGDPIEAPASGSDDDPTTDEADDTDGEVDEPSETDEAPTGEDDPAAPTTTATPSFTTEVPSSAEELDFLTSACRDGDPNACYDIALRRLPRPASLPSGAAYADASDPAVSEACFLDGVPAACFEAGTRGLPPLPATDEPG